MNQDWHLEPYLFLLSCRTWLILNRAWTLISHPLGLLCSLPWEVGWWDPSIVTQLDGEPCWDWTLQFS